MIDTINNNDKATKWNSFDLVENKDKIEYRIILIGRNSKTDKLMIAYKLADNTGEIIIDDLADFNNNFKLKHRGI